MDILKPFFNLIAELISKALSFNVDSPKSPSEKEAVKINDFVDITVNKHFNVKERDMLKRLSITQEAVSEILDEVKEKNFYYIRVLITRLDNLLDIEQIYNILKYDGLKAADAKIFRFISLNDNFEKSEIYVLPVIPTVKTYRIRGNKVLQRKARRDPCLREELKNIFYVQKPALRGYSINNLVYDCELKDENYLIVAASPLCKRRMDELFELDKYEDADGEISANFFSRKSLNSEPVNELFVNVLENCAKENDIDIILGPEFIGTEELNGVDEYGFNETIREHSDGDCANLIVPPTYSANRTNIVSVFSSTGEKLGEQHKQISFTVKDVEKEYGEDLRNSKKEIFILYVKGIGKICFLICRDFLEDYADIVIKELKADLILCPSFSNSASAFYGSVGAATSHDCKVVWINCCTGFNNIELEDAFVGIFAGNYIPDDKKPLECKRDKECNGCYFKIKIPLNAASDKIYTDKDSVIEQKLL